MGVGLAGVGLGGARVRAARRRQAPGAGHGGAAGVGSGGSVVGRGHGVGVGLLGRRAGRAAAGDGGGGCGPGVHRRGQRRADGSVVGRGDAVGGGLPRPQGVRVRAVGRDAGGVAGPGAGGDRTAVRAVVGRRDAAGGGLDGGPGAGVPAVGRVAADGPGHRHVGGGQREADGAVVGRDDAVGDGRAGRQAVCLRGAGPAGGASPGGGGRVAGVAVAVGRGLRDVRCRHDVVRGGGRARPGDDDGDGGRDAGRCHGRDHAGGRGDVWAPGGAADGPDSRGGDGDGPQRGDAAQLHGDGDAPRVGRRDTRVAEVVGRRPRGVRSGRPVVRGVGGLRGVVDDRDGIGAGRCGDGRGLACGRRRRDGGSPGAADGRRDRRRGACDGAGRDDDADLHGDGGARTAVGRRGAWFAEPDRRRPRGVRSRCDVLHGTGRCRGGGDDGGGRGAGRGGDRRDHTGGRRRGDGGPPGGPGGGRDGRGGPGDGGGRDDDADLHGDGCAGGAGHVRRGRVGTGRRRRPGADRSAERGGPLPRPALPAGRGRSGDGVRGGDPCGRGTRRRAHGAAARRRGRRVPGCDVLEQRAGRPGRGRRGRPGGAWPSERGRAGAAERGAIAAARGRGDGDSRHGDVQVLGGRTSGQSSRGAGAAGELGVHEVRRRSSRVYMERRGDRLLHQYEQVAASPGLQEPVPRARLGDDVRHGHPPPRRGGAERRVRHLQLRVHQLGLAVRGRGQSARDYRRGHAVPVEQPGLLARGVGGQTAVRAREAELRRVEGAGVPPGGLARTLGVQPPERGGGLRPFAVAWPGRGRRSATWWCCGTCPTSCPRSPGRSRWSGRRRCRT